MSQASQNVGLEIPANPLIQKLLVSPDRPSDRIVEKEYPASSDQDHPPSPLVLWGYVGPSEKNGWFRLYIALQLDSYYELRMADLVEVPPNDPDDPNAPTPVTVLPTTTALFVRKVSGAALSQPNDCLVSPDQKNALRSMAAPQETSQIEPKICEEFQGFVEKIEEDKAYVRLDSTRGERLCGPYPAAELAANGIGERDRFLLNAVEVNGAVRFDAVLVPRKRISPERQRQIREEIEAGLEGFTPDDER